jgi:hypothetical protein
MFFIYGGVVDLCCSFLANLCLVGANFLVLVDTTANKTGSSGGNETNLLSRRSVSAASRSETDVLLVTTSVWMLDWVHSHTSNNRPHFPSSLVLVELLSGLENWLFNNTSRSNQSDHGSALSINGLSGTRWELYSGLAAVFSVTDDSGTDTAGSGIASSVSRVQFNVANCSTFRDLADRKDISDCQMGFGTGVDVLSSVHTFSSKEIFSVVFVSVWISEFNFNEWGTSTRVVDDASDDTLKISISFSVVQMSKLWSSNSFVSV